MNETDGLNRIGVVSGVVGPLLLAVYFGAPALTGWPYAGADPDHLLRYAQSHEQLFYAGGWLQVTGALLSLVFLLVLVIRRGQTTRFSGLCT